jgi:hypothetical protein
MTARHASVFAAVFLAFSAAVSAQDALTVVDSTGKVLGPVLDTTDVTYYFAEVAMKAGKQIFIVSLNRTDIRFGPLPLFYESTDCSGIAYFGTCNPLLTGCSTIGPGNPGHSLFVRAPDALRASVSVRSQFQSGFCDTFTPFTLSGLPATSVVNLESTFTAPFHLRPSSDVIDVLE